MHALSERHPALRLTLGRLLLALGLALTWGCASTPPPKAVVQPPSGPPPLPAEPIPKSEYLQGAVRFDVEEVFVGTPMYRSVLHWLVTGRLHNLGNRTISWAQVLFRFEETGHLEKIVVLDQFQEQLPLPPRESRVINVPTARLTAGVVGPIDAAKVESLPPPTVTGQVIDLRFTDESP